MSFCAGKKKNGAPCGGKPTTDSAFCAFHEPRNAKKLAAGRVAGGIAATTKPPVDESLKQPLPLESPTDVVCIARDAVNRVRSGALTPKQGTAIGSLLSAALQGMKANREQVEEDKQKQGERPLVKASVERLQELAGASFDAEH